MGLCGIVRCCSFCRVIICVPLIAHSADLGDAVPAGQDEGMKDDEGGAVVVAASVEPSMSTLSEIWVACGHDMMSSPRLPYFFETICI